MTVINNKEALAPYGLRKNIYKKALTSLYNKKKIWEQLKADRLLRQKDKALEKYRFLFYKKIYTIDNERYYKVLGLDEIYYIREDSLNYLPSSQFIIQLCSYTVEGMRYKRALMKVDKTKDRIFISTNTLKILFKPCKLENIS